ncbi:MAG: hypothetical protein Q7R71_01625, partial [bacterium]|nr:hypothetical protein [bacterium]
MKASQPDAAPAIEFLSDSPFKNRSLFSARDDRGLIEIFRGRIVPREAEHVGWSETGEVLRP